MSEPGNAAFLYDSLPADMPGLCRAVQGLLVHADWAAAYGLPDFPPDARTTLALAQRLGGIARTDARPPAARQPGTCRDYALMLCSVLRHRGLPARVRCGFAAYFKSDGWEDHWLCEYWPAGERRWRRIDAQLDEVQRGELGIGFDITDVPPDKFLTAGEAWRRCRDGIDGAESFGHGDTCGLWFVRVDVVRDHYALNQTETSPWDTWRLAADRHRTVSESDYPVIDALAARPDASKLDLAPPWLP